MKKTQVDFEKLFKKGHRSYDTAVGDWWLKRAADPAHARAYRRIAEEVAKGLSRAGKKRGLVVDYACGNGAFLCELARALPGFRLLGLDGSEKMLEAAKRNLGRRGFAAEIAATRTLKEVLGAKAAGRGPGDGPRILLARTFLPNFSLPKGLADAATFVFPNIAPAPSEQEYYDRHGYKNPRDVAAGRILARLREMDPEDEVVKLEPDLMFDGLMTDRVVSRNLRSLLKPGGSFFKVDYANARREDLSELTQLRSLFCEGALEKPVKDKQAEVFFRYRRNAFTRSSVILDVYHQTLDPSDKTGGYFVSEFTAV